jgi:hypothetical protein
LLDVAASGAPIGVVLADAEFDSEANHEHIRQRLGAKSIIPARRRGVPNGTIRNQMFRAFPKKPYRQRNKIESIFSAVKRKLSSRAPGRSLATQIRQALLLGLAYNIYRLRHRFTHRGCQQSPTLASISISVDSEWLNGEREHAEQFSKDRTPREVTQVYLETSVPEYYGKSRKS